MKYLGSIFLGLILLLGITFRAFITAVPPVLSVISHDLGLSQIESGLTTALPLVCFGIFSFLAPAISYRFGLANTIGLALIFTFSGGLLRIWPVRFGLFMGILLIGLGISLGNVLVPVSIRKNWAGKVAWPMTVFSFGLNLGAALGATLTIPIMSVFQLSWNWALAIWPVLTILIAIGWWGYNHLAIRIDQSETDQKNTVGDANSEHSLNTDLSDGLECDSNLANSPVSSSAPISYRTLLKDPQIWLLLGFMGNQSLSYYTQVTWLPSQLQSTGLTAAEAGFWLGAYSLIGMFCGTLGPSIVCSKKGRPLMSLVFLAFALGSILILVGGIWTMFGIVLTGMAQGIAFSGILTLIVHLYQEDKVAQVSAVVQGCGYLVAACGPVINGIILTLFTGWVAPTCLLIGSMTIAGICAVLAIPSGKQS